VITNVNVLCTLVMNRVVCQICCRLVVTVDRHRSRKIETKLSEKGDDPNHFVDAGREGNIFCFARRLSRFAFLLFRAPNDRSTSEINNATRDRFSVINISTVIGVNIDKELELLVCHDEQAKKWSVADIKQNAQSMQLASEDNLDFVQSETKK